MKSKRLISALLVLVLAFSLVSPALAGTTPDDWAVSEMNEANMKGLLTSDAAKDFTRPLTRREFCELVVVMVEQVRGSELPLPGVNPFTDCNEVAIRKAYNYGVVEGVGGTRFDPNSNVERQQIVTMMVRAITKLESDTGKTLLVAGSATLPFKDSSSVSDYAVQPLKVAHSNGIIKGDNFNKFNPKNSITSQECVAVVLRSYNKMQNSLDFGLTQSQLVQKTQNNLTIGLAYGDTMSGITQNVLLPTTGATGVSISWTSSNPAVISNTGVVTKTSLASGVTLKATMTIGGHTLTKEFYVVVSAYSGDAAIAQNAYEALEIYYCGSTDSATSVTSNIILPATVLGLPVTWTSSNAAVINTNGTVTPPTDGTATTVTLTATFAKGAQSKTKTFSLTINGTAAAANGVTLHGVSIGMTNTQVRNILGTAKTTITMATNESWHIYHTNYTNFIAVAYQGSTVAAVYSMSASVASQLKDSKTSAIINVASANATTGISATSYTDANNSNRQYAIMIYGTTSTIASSRTLQAAGAEKLVFELVNAFRVANGRTALIWNDKLGTSARSHSAEMGTYNYFNATGRNGSTYATRASALGYDESLVIAGNIAAGQVDAVSFFSAWVGSAAQRTNMLSASATVLGVGFSGGHSGTYKTYCTQVFGSIVPATGITSPSAIAVGTGITQTVTLTVAPTNCNETFSWTSSNTSICTVSSTTNGRAFTVYGARAGTASIIVTANSSGATFTIPVTVGSNVYASSMSLSGNYLVGVGEAYRLTPTMTPASGPIISWSSNNGSIATVDTTGTVRGVTVSTTPATITATVASSATTNITQYANVYVGSLNAIGVTSGSTSLNLAGVKVATLSTYASAGLNISWTSSNPSIATVSGSNTAATVTGISAGQVIITATATRSGMTGSIVKTIVINVTGSTEYASDLTLSQSGPLIMGNGGNTIQLSAATTPASVTHGTITWTSSNPAAATVDATGKVTSVNPGKTTITATIAISANGGFLSRSIDVYVMGISIASATGVDTVATGSTIQYLLTINTGGVADFPAYGAANITWNSGNPTVASVVTSGDVNSALVVGVSAGYTTVSASIKIGNTTVTSAPITVTVTV